MWKPLVAISVGRMTFGWVGGLSGRAARHPARNRLNLLGGASGLFSWWSRAYGARLPANDRAANQLWCPTVRPVRHQGGHVEIFAAWRVVLPGTMHCDQFDSLKVELPLRPTR